VGDAGLEVAWTFAEARVLRLVANLGPGALEHAGPDRRWGRRLYALGLAASHWTALPPWSVAWFLSDGRATADSVASGAPAPS
jgi:hypothetical protein